MIDGTSTAFDPAKKPASLSAEDFQKAKGQTEALAHNALAWAASSKKDNAATETEYKASLQADPAQSQCCCAVREDADRRKEVSGRLV